MALLAVFRGHVQGVGFRYNAYWVAQSHNVAGWVRNCPDGSVEMFLQGHEGEVDAMLKAVKEKMRDYVVSVEARNVPDEPKNNTFRIRP